MHTLSRLTGGVVLMLALALPAAAQTQEPKAPAADPVKEQQKRRVDQPGNNAPVWREVVSGQPNYASIPGPEAGVLIQAQARFPGQDAMTTAGEAWRKFRNGPVTFYGGWLLVICLAVLAAIHFGNGPVKLHEKPTGRQLPRFSLAERWTHWTVAISFCVLGASGLIILFGKHVLLPIIGYTLFAWLTALAKNLHNFVAPLFIASLAVFIVLFARDNLPQKGDVAWLATAWRMFTGGEQPASGRFNAGEKVWFWVGVVTMCLLVSASGVILLFPNFDQLRATMQQAHVVHVVTAVLIVGYALAHIYMGTIGVEGAYENMRDGTTDEAWAKEHHRLWYDEVKGSSAGGGAVPAGAARSRQQ